MLALNSKTNAHYLVNWESIFPKNVCTILYNLSWMCVIAKFMEHARIVNK